MKKIMLVFVMVLVTFSCKVFDLTNKPDTSQFSIKDNTILYKGVPLARLQAITYSLDGGELVREMNFELLQKKDEGIVEKMIYYLHQTHQDDEIEVEVNIDVNFESIL